MIIIGKVIVFSALVLFTFGIFLLILFAYYYGIHRASKKPYKNKESIFKKRTNISKDIIEGV